MHMHAFATTASSVQHPAPSASTLLAKAATPAHMRADGCQGLVSRQAAPVEIEAPQQRQLAQQARQRLVAAAQSHAEGSPPTLPRTGTPSNGGPAKLFQSSPDAQSCQVEHSQPGQHLQASQPRVADLQGG